MGGKYAHELTELTETADSDVLVVEDADAPSVLKKISVATLKGIFGTGGAIDPGGYAGGSVSNPSWEVSGIQGGWRVRITSVVSDALFYCIQRYNVNTTEYDNVHVFFASLQTTGSQEILYADFEADNITIASFAQFRIITINTDSEKSNPSAVQSAWSLCSVAPDWTPSAPTLISAGGYPEIIQTKAKEFLVRVKIQAPSGERQRIKAYEIEVEDGDWSDPTWSGSGQLKTFKRDIDAISRPLYVFFEIERSHWGYNVDLRIRVRAIAIEPSGRSGTWSSAQIVDTSADVTALDTPVITAIKLSMGAFCFFEEPKRSSVVAPDLDYWHLQYRLDGGAATNVQPDGKVYDKTYKLEVAQSDLAKTIEFRAMAYDYAGNASAWTGWTTAVTPDKVLKTGLSIDKLSDVSTTPGIITTGAGGGTNAIRTAATGARVEMPDLLDSNRGLTVWDDASTRVFSVLNAGADVGDVIIGDTGGHHVKWDKSAAQLQINGLIAASGGLATAASGKRLHIYDVVANAVLSAFDTGGTETVILYPDAGSVGTPRLKLTDGTIYSHTEKDGFYTKDGSAIAAVQISGTGHGEMILYDDSGNLNAKMDSETGYADVASDYRVAGTKVVDSQQATISDPSGGATVDTECRAAVNTIIDRLQAHGLIA